MLKLKRQRVLTGEGVTSYHSNNEVLLLLSGGIDSTACLAYHLNRGNSVSSVFVNYGQSAVENELKAAEAICTHYRIKLKQVTISGAGAHGTGFIKGRNALLLNVALMAFEGSCGLVSIGIHSGTNYSDCTKAFVDRFQQIFDMYSDGKIQISAPLLAWSKPEIWAYCHEQKVPLELTYSCELGTVPPCGGCNSCRDIEALHDI